MTKPREFEQPTITTSNEYRELYSAYQVLDGKLKVATKEIETSTKFDEDSGAMYWEKDSPDYQRYIAMKEALNKIRGEG